MSNKILRKGIAGLLIVTVLLMIFMPNIARAENGLTLEKSHEWVTGSYSYSMADAAGDVDGDGVTEIITAGYFYNSTLTLNEGEVNVWSWNGTSLNEEHKEIIDPAYTWSSDTRFYTVEIGNIDNETDTEIVVAGYGNILGIMEQGLLITMSWNGTAMERENIMYWPQELNKTMFFDLAIGDVDKDNTMEIIAVGYRNTTSILGTGLHGIITIWNATGTELTLETSDEWLISGDTVWYAVSIEDVDADENPEIVIAGYFYDKNLKHECAIIRICTWDGSTLYWEASSQWYTYLDTYAFDIASGDLDSDGIKEIVTIGHQKNSDGFYAQLRIWSWDGNTLSLKLSVEGGYVGTFADTSGKALAINDVDKDGEKEIIAGADVSQLVFSVPIVRIFSWNGKTLTTEDSKNWEDATNLQDIAIADVDADGTVEIITAGYYQVFMPPRINSELAIWSVSKVLSSITVDVNPSTTVIGNQVTISGYVMDEAGDRGIPNVEVTIMSSREPLPVFTTIGKVRTDENGEYSLSWIPQAPGEYTIMVIWNGDYEHEGTTATTTLTVEKASSMITLALSSYTVAIWEEISISGTLYPAKTAQITIEFTNPEGIIPITKTVNANEAGFFSTMFTPNQTGTWTIKAKWNGDETYKSTESAPATLTITKISSAITIAASALTVNVNENVTITGTLTPGQVATITLTYTMPNGTATTRTVASTSTGTFTDTIKLDQAGVWQIKASWNGNEECEAAESASLTLTAQTVDQLTQTLAITGFGLGLIALILALVGIYMALRKKTNAPPQAPTPTPSTQ